MKSKMNNKTFSCIRPTCITAYGSETLPVTKSRMNRETLTCIKPTSSSELRETLPVIKQLAAAEGVSPNLCLGLI